MTIDEGAIKYRGDWTPGPAPDPALTALLERWRRPLYDRGLIGEYETHGIGYGNLSVRAATPGRFVISGTQTGRVAETRGEHYALVTAYDTDANRLDSTGPVAASSEALTHAALYELDDAIGAVVHVHDHDLWRTLAGVVAQKPTRDENVFVVADSKVVFARTARSAARLERIFAVRSRTSMSMARPPSRWSAASSR